MKKIILLLSILVEVSFVYSQTHFVVGYTSENPYDPMNITIKSAEIDGSQLVAGDEIAVYDGNLCCGVIVFDHTINPSDDNTYIILKASANDGNENGFTNGNKMYFRIWDSSENSEYYNVIADLVDNTGATVSKCSLTMQVIQYFLMPLWKY